MGRGAGPGGRDLPTDDCRARPGFRGALRLGPVADRGLLRRQQVRQGPDRHGEYRHKFKALHGLDRCGAQARLRHGHSAGHLRGSGRGRSGGARRLEPRVVPPGALPAHPRGTGVAGHEDRGDRPAPHGLLRRGRAASGRSAGIGRDALQRASGRDCPAWVGRCRLRAACDGGRGGNRGSAGDGSFGHRAVRRRPRGLL